METLDLTKILAGCPTGTSLFSTIHGKVKLESVDTADKYDYAIKVTAIHNGQRVTAQFARDGRFYKFYHDGECVLFPSKDCRDWSQFKQPQKTQFAKGDHVLWRNNDNNEFLGVFVGYTENEQGVISMFQGDHYCGVDIYINDLTK